MSDDFEDEAYEPEPSIEELKELAADWRTESSERLQACLAVRGWEPETGRDLLLALSIALDVEDEDRLSAIEQLARMDASVVAAVSWLMWQTEWGHLEGGNKGHAASIVSGHRITEDDLATGLALIVVNPYLDDLYRIWAGAQRVIESTRHSFAELRARFNDAAILAELDEIARRNGQTSEGVLVGHTALKWIVEDSTLPVSMRFGAADQIHISNEKDGADAFEKLATDPNLEQSQRLRAARELAGIDAERAARVRRETV